MTIRLLLAVVIRLRACRVNLLSAAELYALLKKCNCDDTPVTHRSHSTTCKGFNPLTSQVYRILRHSDKTQHIIPDPALVILPAAFVISVGGAPKTGHSQGIYQNSLVAAPYPLCLAFSEASGDNSCYVGKFHWRVLPYKIPYKAINRGEILRENNKNCNIIMEPASKFML